ncbi:hypothetical protein [Xenorhabdus bovienii]|uniref:hypothetical protein n=1 Tax=Xenorhabdus bovienii TaxID=40576 RepID=UPI0023B2E7F6|nr:hypothetical protein [Xenorhabdus bovienii]MDE9455793.1 hypothetical protein [Xenorhabdus bovienii]MDE9564162.1 hypothetical protein [Xenorhabdus bovienii]
MKKREEVVMVPRRRDAAKATPYNANELELLSDTEKNQKIKKFCSSPLSNKYFKL